MSLSLPFRGMRARKAIRTFISGAQGISGAVLVEFALFAPVPALLAIGTMDYGLYIFTRMEVQNAAQAGAQYAISQTTYDSAAISSAVTHATKFTAITAGSSQYCGCASAAGVAVCAASCDLCSTASCPAKNQGNYIKVTATPTTTYKPFISYTGILTGTPNMNAQATVRIR